jgi:hypothetical protein
MRLTAIALSLAAFAAVAAAQELKPGLWEMQTKVSADGKPMPGMDEMAKQMQGMSPEQRKMVEQMMAQRGLGLGAGGHSLRYCLTPEDAKTPPTGSQQHGDCKTDYAARSGNRMPFKFNCTQPPSTGEGEVVFDGPHAYTMKMRRTSSQQGEPQNMDIEMQAHRVGDDCGDVKPVNAKKR